MLLFAPCDAVEHDAAVDVSGQGGDGEYDRGAAESGDEQQDAADSVVGVADAVREESEKQVNEDVAGG